MSILSAADVAAITARADLAVSGPALTLADRETLALALIERGDVDALAVSHEALRADVVELTKKVERMRALADDWKRCTDAALDVARSITVERDAALARIAHVEELPPVDCDDDVSDPYFAGWYDGTRAQRDATLATVAPAEAAS